MVYPYLAALSRAILAEAIAVAFLATHSVSGNYRSHTKLGHTRGFNDRRLGNYLV